MRQIFNNLALRSTIKNESLELAESASTFVFALLGVLTFAAVSHAATAVWIGPAAGGDFQNGANWTTNPNPPQAGDLSLSNSVTGTITYSNNTALLLHTFFTGSNVSTTLDVGTKTHSTSALFIDGSDAPNQDVTIQSGTVNVGTTLFVGSGLPADDCDLVITGPNTLVRTSNTGVNSGGVFVGVGGEIRRSPSNKEPTCSTPTRPLGSSRSVFRPHEQRLADGDRRRLDAEHSGETCKLDRIMIRVIQT